MADSELKSVLRRLLRGAGADPKSQAATPARALRLAASRAAEAAVGLVLSVAEIEVSLLTLEDLLAKLEASQLLIGIARGAGPVGIAALDLQTRAAVVEMQTLGKVRGDAAEARPVTGTDTALTTPLVARLLTEIEAAAEATELAGWTPGHAPGSRIADPRAAGLALPQATYRLVRLDLELTAEGRRGVMLLALPASAAAAAATAGAPAARWAKGFREQVMQAPADLQAVLHRMVMPLSAIEALEIGQLLPLSGVTVASVRIEGPDGREVARARLGQVSGLRAVRVQGAAPIQMSEVPPRPAEVGDAAPAALDPPMQLRAASDR